MLRISFPHDTTRYYALRCGCCFWSENIVLTGNSPTVATNPLSGGLATTDSSLHRGLLWSQFFFLFHTILWKQVWSSMWSQLLYTINDDSFKFPLFSEILVIKVLNTKFHKSIVVKIDSFTGKLKLSDFKLNFFLFYCIIIWNGSQNSTLFIILFTRKEKFISR